MNYKVLTHSCIKGEIVVIETTFEDLQEVCDRGFFSDPYRYLEWALTNKWPWNGVLSDQDGPSIAIKY